MRDAQGTHSKPLPDCPAGTLRPGGAKSRFAVPIRAVDHMNNIAAAPSRAIVATAITQQAAWPRLFEVLIGVIAGGVPPTIHFLWWHFQADDSASIHHFQFAVSAVASMLIGASAGWLCRTCWPRAGPASLYRLCNTLVWACAGSFAGYFGASCLFGVNTPASYVLVPFCQGAALWGAMAYARCGGLRDN